MAILSVPSWLSGWSASMAVLSGPSWLSGWSASWNNEGHVIWLYSVFHHVVHLGSQAGRPLGIMKAMLYGYTQWSIWAVRLSGWSASWNNEGHVIWLYSVFHHGYQAGRPLGILKAMLYGYTQCSIMAIRLVGLLEYWRPCYMAILSVPSWLSGWSPSWNNEGHVIWLYSVVHHGCQAGRPLGIMTAMLYGYTQWSIWAVRLVGLVEYWRPCYMAIYKGLSWVPGWPASWNMIM